MSGGLGNQLFKWANGFRVAQAYSAKLYLNLDFYRKYNSPETTQREFLLDSLPSVKKTFKVSPNSSLKKITAMTRIPYKSVSLGSTEEIKNYPGGLFIVSGNFESTRFLPEPDALLGILDSIDSPSKWLQENLNRFQQVKTLALHIRLGDYLKKSEMYNVITENYYFQSIELLTNFCSFEDIVIFTDDVKSAKQYFPTLTRTYKFLENSNNQKPTEVLKLLSCAAGIASTNSTFSWWATYFHKNRKLTTIPQIYSNLTGDKNASDLRLPGQNVILN